MLTIHKTMRITVTFLLIVVPPAMAWGQEHEPLEQRERELLEAREMVEERERMLDEAQQRFERAQREAETRRHMPHEIEGIPGGEREDELRALAEELAHRGRWDAARRTEVEVDRLREVIRRLKHQATQLHFALDDAERAEIAPREIDRLRLEMEFVHQEIAAHEEQIARAIEYQRRELEQEHLTTMAHRLEYVSHWEEVAFDPKRAVMMATQALVELEMGRGQPAEAAATLESLLEQVHELGGRTAIRFALKDVYTEMDQPGEAREQMIQVILENARLGQPLRPAKPPQPARPQKPTAPRPHKETTRRPH